MTVGCTCDGGVCLACVFDFYDEESLRVRMLTVGLDFTERALARTSSEGAVAAAPSPGAPVGAAALDDPRAGSPLGRGTRLTAPVRTSLPVAEAGAVT